MTPAGYFLWNGVHWEQVSEAFADDPDGEQQGVGMTFHVPEKFRITSGPQASSPAFGCNGAFIFPAVPGRPKLFAIASDADGWEHVSVSTTFRCPTWDEMCWIKSQFWDDEDCVVQFHPPRSQYVNCHPYCLHLWRPVGAQFATPPTQLVGSLTGEVAA